MSEHLLNILREQWTDAIIKRRPGKPPLTVQYLTVGHVIEISGRFYGYSLGVRTGYHSTPEKAIRAVQDLAVIQCNAVIMEELRK